MCFYNKLKEISLWRKYVFKSRGQKVFCIGYNKTGTTSMEMVLRGLGYKCPDQQLQERLVVEALFHGNFQPLISLCEKYDAFQDLPFSQGVTYAQVDCLFPGSKFILTVRDSNEWFESLTRFHLHGILKSLSVKDIRYVGEENFKDKDIYLYKNYLHSVIKRHVSVVSENKIQYDWSLLYDRSHRIKIYENRNREIIKYFQDRKNQLLIIDIGKEQDTSKIVQFLGLPSRLITKMPHLNKSIS